MLSIFVTWLIESTRCEIEHNVYFRTQHTIQTNMFLVENLAISDRDYDGPHYDFMSREERFSDGLRKELLFGKKVKELNLPTDEIGIYQT